MQWRRWCSLKYVGVKDFPHLSQVVRSPWWTMASCLSRFFRVENCFLQTEHVRSDGAFGFLGRLVLNLTGEVFDGGRVVFFLCRSLFDGGGGFILGFEEKLKVIEEAEVDVVGEAGAEKIES